MASSQDSTRVESGCEMIASLLPQHGSMNEYRIPEDWEMVCAVPSHVDLGGIESVYANQEGDLDYVVGVAEGGLALDSGYLLPLEFTPETVLNLMKWAHHIGQDSVARATRNAFRGAMVPSAFATLIHDSGERIELREEDMIER